jgi:hypothetical protein
MAAKNSAGAPSEKTPQVPSGEVHPEQIRVRLEEQNLKTTYANAFRTNSLTDEILLDFGLNLFSPPAQQGGQSEIIFQVNERIIMNYYLAKRLALALAQLIRRHEEQFGELELDVSRRRKPGGQA